jgi:hydrogenase maturation protein HypF
MSLVRLQVRIFGVVQGVGFRPFVHRLATEHDLPGWVLNDGNGVTLEVEGDRANLLLFLMRLRKEAPAASWIHALDHRFIAPAGFGTFEIRASEDVGTPRVWVLPDLAICDDCRTDIAAPGNRRHGYAFTNCTNCGPRFTIIEGMPYDRPKTSMHEFEMCPDCLGEYTNPTDRRFHAQPNACPVCGPQLQLLDRAGGTVAGNALQTAADWVREGRILGVKGLGGYHLVVDATNEETVVELRTRKQRPFKPFALMYPDMDRLRRDVDVPEFAAPLLDSSQAPILILPRTSAAQVAPSVAPGSPSLGVFLPSTPLHQLLLDAVDRPIVATSANLSEQPMLFDDAAAREHLPAWCDAILTHDRRIVRPADDSVVQVLQRPEPRPQLLRRARGYAPLPLLAARELPCVLALGGQMNSTFAISRGREVLLSQHLGSLSSYEGQSCFRSVLRDFLHLHELTPELVVHDLHPDYFTTALAHELASSWNIPTLAVQHHHAHLAACAFENELEGEVLALTWDGTGHGPDQTVWGGEFLRGDARNYDRVAALRPFRLPGGEVCARESWRVAVSLLHEAFGEGFPRPASVFDRCAEPDALLHALERGVNSPVATSMGRLFDGVAALLGISQENAHQAQSPQMLEHAAWRHGIDAEPFPLPLIGARFDWAPMIREMAESDDPADLLAARFHHTLIDVAIHMIRAQELPAVLAGGVFCNRYLTEGILTRARDEGLEVHVHSQLPPTDGSLAAGQLWVGVNR